ncbi:MAG: hypothetical protein KGD70_01855 [Candidatus Lokiarchaeota archaeon]|nr:hypothetical protein [Candidatus Lokiarchaeota archaeon]
MLFAYLQMGNINMNAIFPIIIMVAVAAGDILLLKLGLVATKAQKKTRMKWVAGSFLIQFGTVFLVCSPLFLLGIFGFFQGGSKDIIPTVVPIIILSLFIDLNVINVLHQIGLKRSLVVFLLTFAPIVLLMVGLGFYLSGFS